MPIKRSWSWLILVRSQCKNCLMDEAYGSRALRDFIKNKGEKAMIPFRKSSLYPEEFDKEQ
jgi:hypothetical protein